MLNNTIPKVRGGGVTLLILTTAVVMTAIATTTSSSSTSLNFFSTAYASPAGAAAPPMVLTTDNGSVNIEVIQDPQPIKTAEQVKFNFNFLNAATGQTLQHVNHDLSITDQQGNEVVSKPGIHIHEGIDVHSATFPEAGSYTLTIDVKGTGLNEPYDTTHSGKATATLTVAPG